MKTVYLITKVGQSAFMFNVARPHLVCSTKKEANRLAKQLNEFAQQLHYSVVAVKMVEDGAA